MKVRRRSLEIFVKFTQIHVIVSAFMLDRQCEHWHNW